MELKDLIKSVTQMNEDELGELVIKIRSQRATRTTPPRKAASVRKKVAKSKDKLATLLDALPADVKEKLLAKMRGEQ